MLYTEVIPEIGRWSMVGWSLSLILGQWVDFTQASTLHMITWWVHVALIGVFIAMIPATRFLHVITGSLNLALRPSRPMGALAKVDIARVQETGGIGVGEITQFTHQQLLSLDACMECGRCEDVCPAFEARQPLSPKTFIGDLRDHMKQKGVVAQRGMIPSSTLWACTLCQACVYECPVPYWARGPHQ